MNRTFETWWKSLPNEIKEKVSLDNDMPSLNLVNYIWFSNIVHRGFEKHNPEISELYDWITTGQVIARRN